MENSHPMGERIGVIGFFSTTQILQCKSTFYNTKRKLEGAHGEEGGKMSISMGVAIWLTNNILHNIVNGG